MELGLHGHTEASGAAQLVGLTQVEPTTVSVAGKTHLQRLKKKKKGIQNVTIIIIIIMVDGCC